MVPPSLVSRWANASYIEYPLDLNSVASYFKVSTSVSCLLEARSIILVMMSGILSLSTKSIKPTMRHKES
jgi:hypothetical protein